MINRLTQALAFVGGMLLVALGIGTGWLWSRRNKREAKATQKLCDELVAAEERKAAENIKTVLDEAVAEVQAAQDKDVKRVSLADRLRGLGLTGRRKPD